MTTTMAGAPAQTTTTDGWFIHFLRYMLVGAIFYIPVFGWIYGWLSLAKVGYRKRDVLFLWVPIWNAVVVTRLIWRFSAKSVYWSVREDRPSSSMFS